MKLAAIISVSVDHFGYFFMEDDTWWGAFGRLAAPPFFFLMGYAQTRTVPLHWIGLGVVLTLLDSSNNDWTWVTPNILLSFAFIRIARPYVQLLVQRRPWAAYALLVCGLLAVLPIATEIVDYGVEGWLWALVRPIPSPICRQQICCQLGGGLQGPSPSAPATTAERGAYEPAGLLCRRGRLRLAGTT